MGYIGLRLLQAQSIWKSTSRSFTISPSLSLLVSLFRSDLTKFRIQHSSKRAQSQHAFFFRLAATCHRRAINSFVPTLPD